MNLEPLEYYVVVEPIEIKEKTAGGLYLPDKALEKEKFARTEGRLVAVSPAAFRAIDGWPDDAPVPGVGDRVVFSKYNATEIEDGGKVYWLMRDRSIIAKVKE